MSRSESPRARRSVLYVPGSNARALEKAGVLPVDAVIVDLEDAVLPAAKPGARASAVAAASARQFGDREVVIRVNGPDTEWGVADLAAAARSGADGILLPKVDGPEALQAASLALEQLGAPAGLKLWAMAETPRAVLAMEAIASCTQRLAVIVMGTADLGKALRVPETPGRPALLPALAHCLTAARAAGLDILDGVYTHLTDPAGFKAECLQGKQFGFDGKTLIHPGQIDACNEIFGVSDSEAALAAELIAAWESAAATGAGVAVHEGRLVERLHVEEARRKLMLYQTIRSRALLARPA